MWKQLAHVTDLVNQAQVFEFRSVLTGHGPPPAVRSFRVACPPPESSPRMPRLPPGASPHLGGRVQEQHVGFPPGCPPLPLGWGMDSVVLDGKL